MNKVSYMSLASFLGQVYISNDEYYFRSMVIKKDDIITLAIYELTFSRYKTKAIESSKMWKKLYSTFLPHFFIDILLYFGVYLGERKYYGNTITNNKPKYFENIRDEIMGEMMTKMKKKVIVEYIDSQVIINKKKLGFKSEVSIIRDTVRLYFESVPDWETKSSFTNMEKYYRNNKEIFPSLVGRKFEYETFRKQLSEKNIEIKEKYGIPKFFGIDVSGICCHYNVPENKNPSYNSVT